MLFDILYVLGSLGLILLSAELFINAIEWLGARLKLAEGAVGSVLAAIGTALPETIIPIVAIAADAAHHRLGDPHGASQNIGVGAIIGAPFMLGTLAFFLVGASYLTSRRGRRGSSFDVTGEVIKADLNYFIAAFTAGCGAGVLRFYWPGMPQLLNYALAAALVVFYGLYLRRTLRSGGPASAEALDPLHIIRHVPFGNEHDPRSAWIWLQLAASFALMYFGAQVFVTHFTTLAAALHAPPLVLALLIVPIATELPEKFNSWLWVRRGKDTLAMGNISGAMVFQSTFPVSLGLVFLNWRFDPRDPAIISAALGLLGACIVLIGLRRNNEVDVRGLLVCGTLWLAFLVLVALQSSGVELMRIN